MLDNGHNLAISTLAKGATAQLRSLIDQCDDADVARNIYVALGNLQSKIAVKHRFVLRNAESTLESERQRNQVTDQAPT